MGTIKKQINLKSKINNMKKGILIIILAVQCSAFGQLQSALDKITKSGLSSSVIADGLKEALDRGITKQVSTLATEGGFSTNDLVKIGLPEQLKKVDKTLRKFGLGDLADKGIAYLNAAAEDAVGVAIPIFTDAVTSMTFTDAKNILAGNEDAATSYLKQVTSNKLYDEFNPIIKASFQKVGADKIWETIITKYNGLPMTKDVNPNLPDYVTTEALNGVYKMVAVEEKEIRGKVGERSTDLLKKVFAAQD